MNSSKFHHLQQAKHDQMQRNYTLVKEALAAARKELQEGPTKEKVEAALRAINP